MIPPAEIKIKATLWRGLLDTPTHAPPAPAWEGRCQGAEAALLSRGSHSHQVKILFPLFTVFGAWSKDVGDGHNCSLVAPQGFRHRH